MGESKCCFEWPNWPVSKIPKCKLDVAMVRWVVGSILHGGPIGLFLIPASTLRLV